MAAKSTDAHHLPQGMIMKAIAQSFVGCLLALIAILYAPAYLSRLVDVSRSDTSYSERTYSSDSSCVSGADAATRLGEDPWTLINLTRLGDGTVLAVVQMTFVSGPDGPHTDTVCAEVPAGSGIPALVRMSGGKLNAAE